jgi:hypothetical protein
VASVAAENAVASTLFAAAEILISFAQQKYLVDYLV